MAYHVYILASRRNGTLYIGSTDSLIRRVWEHREGLRPGFTSRYGVKILVWHQAFDTRDDAFHRERQMKGWRRQWKLELIERFNPAWLDLYERLLRKSLGPRFREDERIRKKRLSRQILPRQSETFRPFARHRERGRQRVSSTLPAMAPYSLDDRRTRSAKPPPGPFTTRLRPPDLDGYDGVWRLARRRQARQSSSRAPPWST